MGILGLVGIEDLRLQIAAFLGGPGAPASAPASSAPRTRCLIIATRTRRYHTRAGALETPVTRPSDVAGGWDLTNGTTWSTSVRTSRMKASPPTSPRCWRARGRRGVCRLVVTGADLASSRQAAELAARHPGVLWSTAGVHPHHAGAFDAAQAGELRELLGGERIVAAGECGLDYYRDLAPRAAQRSAFILQLEMALAAGKPVFLHQRDAHEDFSAILRDYAPRLAGGVAHCFTGGRAELDEYVALGLHIGVTGWVCDERRGGALSGGRAAHTGGAADDRDRCAVPAAARPEAAPADPAQRAREPAAHGARDRGAARRTARGDRRMFERQCRALLRPRPV